MKASRFILLIAVLFFSLSCKEETSNSSNAEIDYNDFSKRTFEVYVPPTYNENNPIPLLFAFHGSGGNGAEMRSITAFNDHANERYFIVCYPNAASVNWNEGCNCNIASRLGIDDIGFIEYLIDKFSENYNIDTTKIFAAGFSQGGFFTNNVVCKLSGKFSKAAIVGGAVSRQLSNDCFPSKNTSVLMIQGTNDQAILYNGIPSGNFSYLSAAGNAEFWADKNGCNNEPLIESIPDKGDPSISVRRDTYLDCDNDASVVLYTVFNGGHSWYKSPDLNSTETIVNFFFGEE